MLPKGWVVDVEEECTSFFDPEGNGALQISQYQADANFTSETAIGVFLDEGAEKSILHVKSMDGVDFATCSYIDHDDYFIVWVATCDKLVTLITYNCPKELRGSEIEVATQIVASIRFY
jgi:hypothetical protein